MFPGRSLFEHNGSLSSSILSSGGKIGMRPAFEACENLACPNASKSGHTETKQLMLNKAVDDALRRENDQLKEALALVEEKVRAFDLERKLMRRDLVQLNAAYSKKCQETKSLREELNMMHLQTVGVDDIRSLQQDICRLEAAYADKTQDNERLGGLIDALVDQRRETAERSQTKYKF